MTHFAAVSLMLLTVLVTARCSYVELQYPSDYHTEDFTTKFSVAKGFYGIPGPDSGNFLFGVSKVLGVSMGIEKLAPCAHITLHTHPRGNEFFYMVSGGPVLAYLWFENNTLLTVSVAKGQASAAPLGLAHAQLNDNCQPAVGYVFFDSSNPGTVTIPALLEQVPAPLEQTIWKGGPLPTYQGFLAQSAACLQRCGLTGK